MSAGRVTATVTPSGRWSWYLTVDVETPGSWIGRTVREGVVLGSRERADRIARRWVCREQQWQRRLAEETHEVA